MTRTLVACLLLWCIGLKVYAQDDLMALAMDSSNAERFALPAFKSTRIINGQSVQTVGKNNLHFIISHRFDRLNRGSYEFFGLDAAIIRLGLEYGITDDLTIGIGRSSYFKTYDAFGKYRFLKQTTDNSIPVTIAALGTINIRTQKLIPPESLSGSDKLTYTAQLLLARRFSNSFSLQLSPTYLYRERPEPIVDNKSVFALGIAGSYKLTKRIAFNAEYFYTFPDQIDDIYNNVLSVGFDIETGGHVFQLHFTNSYGMTERYFITETIDSWGEGDIHFGFNITRTFYLGKKPPTAKAW